MKYSIRYHLWRIESTLKSQPDLLAAMNDIFSPPPESAYLATSDIV
jgi:hypothetical protein